MPRLPGLRFLPLAALCAHSSLAAQQTSPGKTPADVCSLVKEAAAVFSELTQAAEKFRGLRSRCVFAPPRMSSADEREKARREIGDAYAALRKERDHLLETVAERRRVMGKMDGDIRAAERRAGPGDDTARSCASGMPTLFRTAQRIAAGMEGEDGPFRDHSDRLQAEGILPLKDKAPPAARFLSDIDCDAEGLDPVRRLAELAAETRRVRAASLKMIRDLEAIRPAGEAGDVRRYLAERAGRRAPLQARLEELSKMRAQGERCSRTSRAANINNEFAAMTSVEKDLDEGRYPVVQAALYGPGELGGLWAEVSGALSADGELFARIEASKEFRLEVDIPPDSRTPPSTDAFAVLIGIERYKSLPGVQFAERDARIMREYLVSAMGFKEANVRLLIDGDASKAEMEKALGRWLKNQATDKSRVFVFFAGHGAPDPAAGDAYLVPSDGDPSYPEETAFPVGRLLKILASLPSRDVTLVLDACFSGAGGRSVLAQGTRPLVLQLKQEAVGPNTAQLSASGLKQISTYHPEGRHGLLTYFLLEGLRGPADSDKDRRITTQELFDYVLPRVQRQARTQNVDQSPALTAGSEAAKGRVWLELKR